MSALGWWSSSCVCRIMLNFIGEFGGECSCLLESNCDVTAIIVFVRNVNLWLGLFVVER